MYCGVAVAPPRTRRCSEREDTAMFRAGRHGEAQREDTAMFRALRHSEAQSGRIRRCSERRTRRSSEREDNAMFRAGAHGEDQSGKKRRWSYREDTAILPLIFLVPVSMEAHWHNSFFPVLRIRAANAEKLTFILCTRRCSLRTGCNAYGHTNTSLASDRRSVATDN